MTSETTDMTKGVATIEREGLSPLGGDDEHDFTPRYFEAGQVRLFRSPMGAARLEIRDESCYPRVTVRRLLPLSEPNRYISLWSGDDAEIGIIEDPSTLDPESLRIVSEELDKRYFAPTIEKIYRVKERFGVHEWEVETTRGRITFSVTGLHQNVKMTPPAQLLVTDVRGNRYEIPDYRKLEPHSFQQIQRHL